MTSFLVRLKEFGSSHHFKLPCVIAYGFVCSLPRHLGILKIKINCVIPSTQKHYIVHVEPLDFSNENEGEILVPSTRPRSMACKLYNVQGKTNKKIKKKEN